MIVYRNDREMIVNFYVGSNKYALQFTARLAALPVCWGTLRHDVERLDIGTHLPFFSGHWIL